MKYGYITDQAIDPKLIAHRRFKTFQHIIKGGKTLDRVSEKEDGIKIHNNIVYVKSTATKKRLVCVKHLVKGTPIQLTVPIAVVRHRHCNNLIK